MAVKEFNIVGGDVDDIPSTAFVSNLGEALSNGRIKPSIEDAESGKTTTDKLPGISLRSIDISTVGNPEPTYDPSGQYVKTIITLRNWAPDAMTDLFGMESDLQVGSGVDTDTQAIYYRFSNDDGVSWQFWNIVSDAWEASTTDDPAEWTLPEDIDSGIQTFPFIASVKQLKIQILLVPNVVANRNRRPVWLALRLYFGTDYVAEEDARRSLRKFFFEKITPIHAFKTKLGATDLTAISLLSSEMKYKLTECPAIYNLTSDPARQINILSGLSIVDLGADDAEGRSTFRYDFTFTGSQTAGDRLEFRCKIESDVRIANSDEDFQISVRPCILLEFPFENVSGGFDELEDGILVERNRKLLVGRLSSPQSLRINVRIHIYADDETSLTAMVKAIRLVMDGNQRQVVRSIASDDDFQIVRTFLIGDESRQGINSMSRTFTVVVPSWGEQKEFGLVNTLDIQYDLQETLERD